MKTVKTFNYLIIVLLLLAIQKEGSAQTYYGCAGGEGTYRHTNFYYGPLSTMFSGRFVVPNGTVASGTDAQVLNIQWHNDFDNCKVGAFLTVFNPHSQALDGQGIYQVSLDGKIRTFDNKIEHSLKT